MVKQAILCVDDEKIVLDTLLDQLISEYHERFHYEAAESVEEAWEVIKYLMSLDFEFVLVISDWQMPGIRGDEFLINVHKEFPKTVKILLTGQADPNSVAHMREHINLDAYITKPWTKQQLIQQINKALQLSA
jgi:CheY-like chemotaxis protein